MKLHYIQTKILSISQNKNIEDLTLRELGKLIGVSHPQIVKYHLQELNRKGLLKDSSENKLATKFINVSYPVNLGKIVEIPILGEANCGIPTVIAYGNVIDYLKLSQRLLVKSKNIFALRAVGDSMIKANIYMSNIDDGDYVIVDSNYNEPKDGDYVVSIINNCANIKKIKIDKLNSRICLLSESTKNYAPIIVHENDIDEYILSGKVIQVIKKV